MLKAWQQRKSRLHITAESAQTLCYHNLSYFKIFKIKKGMFSVAKKYEFKHFESKGMKYAQIEDCPNLLSFGLFT